MVELIRLNALFLDPPKPEILAGFIRSLMVFSIAQKHPADIWWHAFVDFL